LQLTNDKEFEKNQRKNFLNEPDLPLKTIKRAFEASLIKDDPVSTAEMLLLHFNVLFHILKESPLSALKDFDADYNIIKNNHVLEKAWKIADLNDLNKVL
jgi:hypothetical protein